MPNVNAEARFARVPQIEKPRSIFTRPCTHKTSFNVGQVIPIYCDIVYPGTTVKMSTSKVVRLQTLITPILDNMYLDTYWFKIPLRLVWTHAKEFFGENSSSAWIPQVEYQVPSISSPVDSDDKPIPFETGTLADYFGLPLVPWDNEAEGRPMALPFRAYALVMQEFFRSENLTDPLNIPVGDSDQIGSNGEDYINDVANGGKPFIAAKFFDRFTGGLPSPQKGPAVQFGTQATFPGYSIPGQNVPVYPQTDLNPVPDDAYLMTYYGVSLDNPQIRTVTQNNSVANIGSFSLVDGKVPSIYDSSSISPDLWPANLAAELPDLSIPELSIGGVSFSVNELRIAFQLQRYYEALSRSGSRYRELLRNLWGSNPADASLQVLEYLGGNRVPIQIHEVVNTAQATNDYLGDLGAMSHTADVSFDFDASFDEHCVLLGVCVARYDHSYAQGMEPFWNRLRREEWYIPQMANIGELPVYQNEICATEANMAQKVVFAYQEAWSDLRYKQDYITGEMRPGISNSLASWHLSDYYESAPTLSDSWLREDKNIVDRVLAVGSSVSNQIFCDFYFDATYTEVLPMYSVPGLIDHY